jgi:hypothetical protein
MQTNSPNDKRSDLSNEADKKEYGATPFQIGMGLLIVGASAGLTLYTKKTKAMLTQMDRVKKNQDMRKPHKKFGPPTKKEWEKLRNRWEDNDI